MSLELSSVQSLILHAVLLAMALIVVGMWSRLRKEWKPSGFAATMASLAILAFALINSQYAPEAWLSWGLRISIFGCAAISGSLAGRAIFAHIAERRSKEA